MNMTPSEIPLPDEVQRIVDETVAKVPQKNEEALHALLTKEAADLLKMARDTQYSLENAIEWVRGAMALKIAELNNPKFQTNSKKKGGAPPWHGSRSGKSSRKGKEPNTDFNEDNLGFENTVRAREE